MVPHVWLDVYISFKVQNVNKRMTCLYSIFSLQNTDLFSFCCQKRLQVYIFYILTGFKSSTQMMYEATLEANVSSSSFLLSTHTLVTLNAQR